MPINKYNFLLILLIFSKQAMAVETLEQVFADALNKNKLIHAAKADTQASEQQLFAAEGQYLPKLSLSSGYTQFDETPSAKANFGGQSVQFPMNQAGSFNAQAMVSIPVFTSGKIGHGIDAAKAVNLATQHNEMATALNIKLKVANAFIAILRIQKGLIVAQSHVTNLKAHVKDVNNLYQQGMIARNDLLAAKVELSNAEQLVIQQDNQLAIAKAQFNQLLNRNLSDEVELVEAFPEVSGDDLAILFKQALKQRPELEVLAEQIRSLEAQAKSEKANLLPQVNLNGGYQYQENEYQAFEGLWMANVTLNWTLFDGSTNHRSQAVKRQALSLKSQRDDFISNIHLQVRQTWLDTQETLKRIEVAKQAIEQADENLRMSIERYQQGLAMQTEVLDAEDLRTKIYNNFHNAEYDSAMAKLNLRYALGIL
ncbi:MAG: TolC family protein [Methylococcales bacterium]|nr:TolC family protein [Methylococcales bacterium]